VKMSWSLADDDVVVVVAVVVGRGGRGVGGGELVEPPEQQGVPALWATRGWGARTARGGDVETPGRSSVIGQQLQKVEHLREVPD